MEANVLPITRRQFARQAALAATTLCEPSMWVLAAPARHSPPDAAAIRRFTSAITGRVITPDAPDFDSKRLIFNRAFDRRPALIVRCAGSADVARALEFARHHALPVAVRGGGHNRAGLSVCDGGVVIDLSGMNRIEVDAGKRVARAEAGVLTVTLDAATQRFGLATPLAGCPTVGIAGLTLGGGEGFLMSKYGAACDNLLSAELITVDGRRVEASANSNPDLYWAIRGGGGNFAVATALEYRLHPVGEVLAGTLMYAAAGLPELLQAFDRFVGSAPDEMTVVGVVLPAREGRRFVVLVFHCGDVHHGTELLKPLRALDPQEDKVRVAAYAPTNASINPAAPVAHFQTDLFLPELDARAIAAIAAATDEALPNTRVFIVPFYGAITRVGVSDTAFALRRRGYELDIMGRWDAVGDRGNAVRWVRALRDKLQPLAQGAYVNQLGETSEALVRAAYGPNYARLAQIKKRYDPNNVLRLNQNVRPA